MFLIFLVCNAQLANVFQDLIRISVGTEHIDDIIADFEQSFTTSATKPQEEASTEGKENSGNLDAPAGKPVV
jgi:O-acetylhomoserine/O-acetylserine sulfhydrylase